MSKLLSSFKKIGFGKWELSTIKPLSDIKCHYSDFWSNDLFYLFNDLLEYIPFIYFAKFKITKKKYK